MISLIFYSCNSKYQFCPELISYIKTSFLSKYNISNVFCTNKPIKSIKNINEIDKNLNSDIWNELLSGESTKLSDTYYNFDYTLILSLSNSNIEWFPNKEKMADKLGKELEKDNSFYVYDDEEEYYLKIGEHNYHPSGSSSYLLNKFNEKNNIKSDLVYVNSNTIKDKDNYEFNLKEVYKNIDLGNISSIKNYSNKNIGIVIFSHCSPHTTFLTGQWENKHNLNILPVELPFILERVISKIQGESITSRSKSRSRSRSRSRSTINTGSRTRRYRTRKNLINIQKRSRAALKREKKL